MFPAQLVAERRRAGTAEPRARHRDKSTELGREEFIVVITMTDHVQTAYPCYVHKRENTAEILCSGENQNTDEKYARAKQRWCIACGKTFLTENGWNFRNGEI